MFTPREEGKVLVRCVRLKSATGTIHQKSCSTLFLRKAIISVPGMGRGGHSLTLSISSSMLPLSCPFSDQAPTTWNKVHASIRHASSVSFFQIFLKNLSLFENVFFSLPALRCLFMSRCVFVCVRACVCVCVCACARACMCLPFVYFNF